MSPYNFLKGPHHHLSPALNRDPGGNYEDKSQKNILQATIQAQIKVDTCGMDHIICGETEAGLWDQSSHSRL